MLLEGISLGPLLPEHLEELFVGIALFLIIWWVMAKQVVPMFEKTYAERTAAIQGGIEKAEKAQLEAAQALDYAHRHGVIHWPVTLPPRLFCVRLDSRSTFKKPGCFLPTPFSLSSLLLGLISSLPPLLLFSLRLVALHASFHLPCRQPRLVSFCQCPTPVLSV